MRVKKRYTVSFTLDVEEDTGKKKMKKYELVNLSRTGIEGLFRTMFRGVKVMKLVIKEITNAKE